MRKVLMVLIAALAWSDSRAECKFDKMVKIVVRDVTSGINPNSFAGQPRTHYRVGSRYGRTEEAPDPIQRIHGLLIVNEPDAWMINLYTKTGQHMVDPGPTFNVRGTIFWSPGLPEWLRDFEYGCELAYIKTKASGPPESAEVDGIKILRYQMAADGYRVMLAVGREDNKPRVVTFLKDGKVVRNLRYESWQDGLAPDFKLFQPPEGVKIKNNK